MAKQRPTPPCYNAGWQASRKSRSTSCNPFGSHGRDASHWDAGYLDHQKLHLCRDRAVVKAREDRQMCERLQACGLPISKC